MSTATQTQTKWSVDNTHSEVQFKAKHLVISTVTGFFRKFNGEIKTEGEGLENATASFEVDVNSIDTNVDDRDAHLKSDDFFNAEKYPKLTFKNGKFTKKSEDEYTLTGDFTIRDITKKVTLDVELGGIMEDPYGQTKMGMEVRGKINRKEFGLKWNAVTEAGGVVVGDDIKLQLNLQFVKQ